MLKWKQRSKWFWPRGKTQQHAKDSPAACIPYLPNQTWLDNHNGRHKPKLLVKPQLPRQHVTAPKHSAIASIVDNWRPTTHVAYSSTDHVDVKELVGSIHGVKAIAWIGMLRDIPCATTNDVLEKTTRVVDTFSLMKTMEIKPSLLLKRTQADNVYANNQILCKQLWWKEVSHISGKYIKTSSYNCGAKKWQGNSPARLVQI